MAADMQKSGHDAGGGVVLMRDVRQWLSTACPPVLALLLFAGARAAGAAGPAAAWHGHPAATLARHALAAPPARHLVTAPAPSGAAGHHLEGVRALVARIQGSTAAGSAGVSLNLGSSQPSVALSSLPGFQSAVLVLGGHQVAVRASDSVTPAERVALSQVLHTGHQSLLLDARGRAVGGTMYLSPQLSGSLYSLVVPRPVTVIDNVAKTGPLNLSGNFTNYGNFYAISTAAAVTTASLSAANIFNQPGALISTIAPAGPGLAGVIPNLALSLSARHDIVNAGTISSASGLSLKAGGSIVNGLPPGMAAPAPVMQAAGDVRLLVGSGGIINSGLIAATAGNINIVSQTAGSLAIDNSGGTLKALNGAISFGDPSSTGQAGVTVTGGDLLSKQLNVSAGRGDAVISVNSISGDVNVSAGAATTSVAAGTLSLGSMKLSGDPVFYNDSGSVVLKGAITTGGAPLAVLAEGDITVDGGGASINTSQASGAGGSILLAAGVDITSCTLCPTAVLPPPPAGTQTIHIHGFKTQGTIDLTNISELTASGSGSSGGGGAITLLAPNSVSVPASVPITSTGSGTGAGGSVLIMGAGHGGQITTGDIDASGGGAGGQIQVYSTTIKLSHSPVVVTAGSAGQSSFLPWLATAGTITTGALSANAGGNSNAGAISLLSSGDLQATSLTAAAPGTGLGGSVFVVADNLRITSPVPPPLNKSGGTPVIDVSSAGGSAIRSPIGIFGAATIETKSGHTLFINTAADRQGQIAHNYINGTILANGLVNGGTVFFQSSSSNSIVVNVPGGKSLNDVIDVSGKTGTNGNRIFLNARFAPEVPRVIHEDQPGPPPLDGSAGRAGSGVSGGLASSQTGTRIATDTTHGAPGSDDPSEIPDVGEDESGATGGREQLTTIWGALVRTAADVQNLTARNVSLDGQRMAAGIWNPGRQPATLAVRWDEAEKVLRLERGNVLFVPDKDMVITAPEATIKLTAGSIVFVLQAGNRLAVYDLHHGTRGGIRVTSGGRSLPLLPGRQLVVARGAASEFASVNPARRIAYRNPQETSLPGGVKAFVAEFSIPSAMMAVGPLQALLKSSAQSDRKALGHLLKDSAIFADVTAGSGEFLTAGRH